MIVMATCDCHGNMYLSNHVILQVEEFASDQLYNASSVNKATVEQELSQLGMTGEGEKGNEEDNPLDIDDKDMWDELKVELEELDLEGSAEGGVDGDIPPDWEEELQSMLSDDLSKD